MSTQEPTRAELEEIQGLMTADDEKDFRKKINRLSILMRALDGIDVSGDDVISKLINTKDILERSNYPTYPQLYKALYWRLCNEVTGIKIYLDASNLESSALTSYKGKSREQYVEMSKAPQLPEQLISLGQRQQEISQPKRAHFWNRTAEQKENETIE